MNSIRPADPESPGVLEGCADAGLARRARRGEREALEVLLERYRRMVAGVLVVRVRPDQVDDLIQETFLRACGRIADLRDPERFGPWLATIARNLATDTARARAAMELELPDDLPDPAGAPDSTDAEAREILEILAGIGDPYREALAMRLVEGMTGPEIAAATGRTPGSVRVHLHRGMKILRRKLEKEGWA